MKAKLRQGNIPSTLYYSLVLIIALFSVYFYQVAWGWPIVDSYPQIERILNDDYLLKDFYTNTFEDFSPRLYIAYFYILGAKIFNVDYSVFVGIN